VALLLGALALSALLAIAALVDQTGSRTLMDHAHDVYASHGTSPSAGVVYGLVYSVAAVGVLLWWGTLVGARSGRRWAPWATVVATVVTAVLAVTLLAAGEYGEQVYPAFWGMVALLSPLAGALAAVPLVRRRTRS
jgi:hypothetical protein